MGVHIGFTGISVLERGYAVLPVLAAPALIVDLVLSIGLGAILVLSAIPKLRYSRTFMLQVLDYRIVGLHASRFVAYVLPAVELAVGLMLIAGVAARVAAIVVAALLMVFLAAISLNLVRGRRIECGCFRVGRSRTIGWPILLQDLVLLVAASELLRRGTSWSGSTPWSPLHSVYVNSHADAAIIGLCVLVAATATRRAYRASHPLGRSSRLRRASGIDEFDRSLMKGR